LWVSGDTGVVGVERISSNAVYMCHVTLGTGKLADSIMPWDESYC